MKKETKQNDAKQFFTRVGLAILSIIGLIVGWFIVGWIVIGITGNARMGEYIANLVTFGIIIFIIFKYWKKK